MKYGKLEVLQQNRMDHGFDFDYQNFVLYVFLPLNKKFELNKQNNIKNS